MASGIGLNMKLTASINQFQKSMGLVNSKLEAIDRSSRKTASGMKILAAIEIGKLAAKGLSSMASGFKSATSAAIRFFETNRQVVDALGKMSDSTGVAAPALQVFGRIAEEQGVPLAALSGGFGRMNKRLAEAKQGFGEALKPLQNMGMNIEALASLRPEQAFIAIAKAISKLPTHGEKAAAAFKIFSDQGLQLFPLFDGIEERVKNTAAEMSSLGQILSTTQVDAIERMNDAMRKVSATAEALGQHVLASFAPMIEDANEALLKFVKNFKFDGEIGGVAIAKFLVEAFKKGVILLADWSDSFYSGLKTVVKTISGIFIPLIETLQSIGRVFNEFVKMWSGDFTPMPSAEEGLASIKRFTQSLDDSGLGLGKLMRATVDNIPPIERQTGELNKLNGASKAYEDALKTKKSKAAQFAESMTKAKAALNKSTTLIPAYLKSQSAVNSSNQQVAKSATAAASSLNNVAGSTQSAAEKLAAFTNSFKQMPGAGTDPILAGIGQNLQKEAALAAWQNVADGIMSQFESMGLNDYARQQLQAQMQYEKSQYEGFVVSKLAQEQKIWERKAAREARAEAAAKRQAELVAERNGKVLTFLDGFRDRFSGEDFFKPPDAADPYPAGEDATTAIKEQTPILGAIRDALQKNSQLVLTSIA